MAKPVLIFCPMNTGPWDEIRDELGQLLDI